MRFRSAEEGHKAMKVRARSNTHATFAYSRTRMHAMLLDVRTRVLEHTRAHTHSGMQEHGAASDQAPCEQRGGDGVRQRLQRTGPHRLEHQAKCAVSSVSRTGFILYSASFAPAFPC